MSNAPARNPLLTEREKTHGDFGEVAVIAQKLKTIFRSAPNWEGLDDMQREALEMKATKLARLLCGDYRDPEHWRDDVGYSALILERLPGGCQATRRRIEGRATEMAADAQKGSRAISGPARPNGASLMVKDPHKF